jgi:hypothetical protein
LNLHDGKGQGASVLLRRIGQCGEVQVQNKYAVLVGRVSLGGTLNGTLIFMLQKQIAAMSVADGARLGIELKITSYLRVGLP